MVEKKGFLSLAKDTQTFREATGCFYLLIVSESHVGWWAGGGALKGTPDPPWLAESPAAASVHLQSMTKETVPLPWERVVRRVTI